MEVKGIRADWRWSPSLRLLAALLLAGTGAWKACGKAACDSRAFVRRRSYTRACMLLKSCPAFVVCPHDAAGFSGWTAPPTACSA